MSKDGSSDQGEQDLAEEQKPQTEEPVDEDLEESSEEEESEEEDEEDNYATKLRSGKTRSTPHTDSAAAQPAKPDKKQPAKGKKPLPKKRKGPPVFRGRKKAKITHDAGDDKRGESDSDDSYRHPEDEVESTPAIVQKFLYNPGIPWPDLSPYLMHDVEVKIAREFLTLANKEVCCRRLWGTDVYTSDSDLVAVIQHAGLLDLSQPFSDHYEGVAVYLRISKGRSNYVSTYKNGIKSNKCVNYEGHSVKPEKLVYLTNLGSLEELREMASRMPTDFHRQRVKPSLNMRKTHLIPQAFLLGSLSLELWPVYSLDYLGDKGRDEYTYLSTRLKSEVLYLETDTDRYELSRITEESSDADIFAQGLDKYRWSQVKPPMLMKGGAFMSEAKVPLDGNWVKLLHRAVEWQEIQWGSQFIQVKGATYGPLTCVKFFQIRT